jgi:hypothetical protein
MDESDSTFASTTILGRLQGGASADSAAHGPVWTRIEQNGPQTTEAKARRAWADMPAGHAFEMAPERVSGLKDLKAPRCQTPRSGCPRAESEMRHRLPGGHLGILSFALSALDIPSGLTATGQSSDTWAKWGDIPGDIPLTAPGAAIRTATQTARHTAAPAAWIATVQAASPALFLAASQAASLAAGIAAVQAAWVAAIPTATRAAPGVQFPVRVHLGLPFCQRVRCVRLLPEKRSANSRLCRSA